MSNKPTRIMSTPPVISSKLEAALEDEILRFRANVESRARQLSLERVSAIRADMPSSAEETEVLPSVVMEDLARALDETLGRRTAEVPQASFFDLFPPFTCLCFLLCLVFGGFGLRNAGGKDTGFLDIAKIFAGALAGSTTTNAISRIRAQRRAR